MASGHSRTAPHGSGTQSHRPSCATLGRLRIWGIVCEPSHSRRGGSAASKRRHNRLCAAIPTHRRARCAESRPWRAFLHGLRPGWRRRHRGGAGRCVGANRVWRWAKRGGHDRECAARPHRNAVGGGFSHLRGVLGTHPGERHHRAGGRFGAATAIYRPRRPFLLRRLLQRALARPSARGRRESAQAGRAQHRAALPLLSPSAARRPPHRRVLPRPLALLRAVHGPARRRRGALRIQVPELL